MASYQQTFQRTEKKYLLSASQFTGLYRALQSEFEADAYGQSTIYNVYFDTPSHLLIRRSLEKPVYKEKLRLRSYKRPAKDDLVFVELKKKYQGVVYKRREAMSYEMARACLYEGNAAMTSGQIARELDWTLHSYGALSPAMFLSYDRLALQAKADPALRITFDTNVLYRENELLLESDAPCRPLLAPGQVLMEIKAAGAFPLYLTRLLSESLLYPTSFSKYGLAFLQSTIQQSSTERTVSLCSLNYLPQQLQALPSM